MGFAIKRADGTYRCWNRNAKDDVLRSGETWEARDTAPLITPDPMTAAEIDARNLARFDGEKLAKALAIWTAQKLGVSLATARAEILEIYKGL